MNIPLCLVLHSNWRTAWMSLENHGSWTLETERFMDPRFALLKYIIIEAYFSWQTLKSKLIDVTNGAIIHCFRLTLRSKMQLDATTSVQPSSWTSNCPSASTWPLWGESPNQYIDALLRKFIFIHSYTHMHTNTPIVSSTMSCVLSIKAVVSLVWMQYTCIFFFQRNCLHWFSPYP